MVRTPNGPPTRRCTRRPAPASACGTGLNPAGAAKASRQLRSLLGSDALAITDTNGVLAWDGAGEELKPLLMELAAGVLDGGHTAVIPAGEVQELAQGQGAVATRTDVERAAVIAPIKAGTRVVGVVAAFGPAAGAGLVRATSEVAGWVATQLELAELDASRTRLMEAEVRALRAQISPHFIYNSLTAIASFVRTDPERARELLLEFADFTRYSFRRHGEFTTLAEELRSIERYLAAGAGPVRRPAAGHAADRARGAAGRRAVPVPAAAGGERRPARPGGARRARAGSPSSARDAGSECRDHRRGRRRRHGPGRSCGASSPGTATASTSGWATSTSGCGQVYGDDYGLVVETAPGAGTKVTMRVPKFQPAPRCLTLTGPAPAACSLGP